MYSSFTSINKSVAMFSFQRHIECKWSNTCVKFGNSFCPVHTVQMTFQSLRLLRMKHLDWTSVDIQAKIRLSFSLWVLMAVDTNLLEVSTVSVCSVTQWMLDIIVTIYNSACRVWKRQWKTLTPCIIDRRLVMSFLIRKHKILIWKPWHLLLKKQASWHEDDVISLINY